MKLLLPKWWERKSVAGIEVRADRYEGSNKINLVYESMKKGENF